MTKRVLGVRMEDDILASVKDAVGVGVDDTAFDEEILLHINTVFVALRQLGVGPDTAFIADEDSLWTDFLDNQKILPMIKSYVVLRVRLLFDPPNSSSFNEAIKNSIAEYEWRLQMECDTYKVEEDSKYASRVT